MLPNTDTCWVWVFIFIFTDFLLQRKTVCWRRSQWSRRKNRGHIWDLKNQSKQNCCAVYNTVFSNYFRYCYLIYNFQGDDLFKIYTYFILTWQPHLLPCSFLIILSMNYHQKIKGLGLFFAATAMIFSLPW